MLADRRDVHPRALSTREVEAVMREFPGGGSGEHCLRRRSAAPPSCWMRSCRLGATDRSARSSISSSTPRYEKMRHAGLCADVAVALGHRHRTGLSAAGCLGVSVALSEAEVHWRDVSSKSLVARGNARGRLHRLR